MLLKILYIKRYRSALFSFLHLFQNLLYLCIVLYSLGQGTIFFFQGRPMAKGL